MSWTNFTNRINLANAAAYDPTNRGGGRQFASSVKPVLPSTRTHGSALDALLNNSVKYKDEDGTIRYIKVVEDIAPQNGGQGTYRLALDGSAEGKGKPKLAVSSSNPRRKAGAIASTASNANLTQSAIKYQNINDKNKQSHHVMEVVEHSGAFIGRSPESKAYILGKLSDKGFFPGDDRRNYTALTGNKMFASDGSMFKTGALDQHQGYVHSNQSVASEVQKMLPSAEEFSRMTDDEVVVALLPSALAGRYDVQSATGVSTKALDKTSSQLARATAKAIAQSYRSRASRGEAMDSAARSYRQSARANPPTKLQRMGDF